MKSTLVLIATFFNIGRFPIAPGTLASLITATVIYLSYPLIDAPIYVRLIAIVFVFIIGIPAATEAERYFKKKDPGEVVLDEVAGQMVSLLFIPYSLGLYILNFFLFRFFDIFKPFPIGLIDRKVKGGFGIMFDDIIAGFYAMLCTLLIIWLI